MRGRNTGKPMKVVNVRVPTEDLAVFAARSAAANVSVSDVLREALASVAARWRRLAARRAKKQASTSARRGGA